jgi:hypothetical protein
MEPKETNELYYSDSAIRERCLKMVCDYRTALAGTDRNVYFRSSDQKEKEAESLFQYIKTGAVITDGDKK